MGAYIFWHISSFNVLFHTDLFSYKVEARSPVWKHIWDVTRPLVWEGYVLEESDPLFLRTVHLNKLLTKLLKIAANAQVMMWQKVNIFLFIRLFIHSFMPAEFDFL